VRHDVERTIGLEKFDDAVAQQAIVTQDGNPDR
jgi:hypothetical protein